MPAPHANGVAVCAVFDRWAGKLDVDDRFDENVTMTMTSPFPLVTAEAGW
ncbi:hypothetical protein [Amycolatopsis sp. cg9]